jgi:CHAD domain-containing protein
MELDFVKLKQIKPVLSDYIRESQTLMRASVIPADDTVHDIRVLMKKARAAIKLLRTQLDEESFNRENLSLRQVGRILRTWRDTSVHRKTLKDLRKKHPDIFKRLQDNDKLNLLLRKPEPVPEPSEECISNTQQIDELLKKAGFRIRFHSMNSLNPQLLIKELELTYNCVVNKYLICRNNPKSENLHEFRKKSKDFLYQLFFFRPLNPSVIKELEKKLDIMTQNLGKYNDIAQLVKSLDYKYENSRNLPALDELIIMLCEEQDKYLLNVWPSAYKIFCPGQKLLNILGFKLLVI